MAIGQVGLIEVEGHKWTTHKFKQLSYDTVLR